MGILFDGESFPHTYFAAGSSLSHEFIALTKRKLLELKVTYSLCEL